MLSINGHKQLLTHTETRNRNFDRRWCRVRPS